MRLGMIGLGRMGGNMVQRLQEGGHQVVVFDRSADAIKVSVGKGASASKGLADLCKQLTPPRIVWMMVPAGDVVEDTIAELLPNLAKGRHPDRRAATRISTTLTMRRAESAGEERASNSWTAGTSGGSGASPSGYCLMVGAAAGRLRRPASRSFKTSRRRTAAAHVGPPGSGHYVKMIHNGIEYGMLHGVRRGLRDPARVEELRARPRAESRSCGSRAAWCARG